MGCFDGWWQGVDDGRPDRANVTEEVWDSVLRKSGFDGIQAAVRDNNHPHLFNSSNIIARPCVDASETTKKRVTLLKPNEQLSPFAGVVKDVLEASGLDIDERTWGTESLPEGQDIVSVVDLDGDRQPLLANVGAKDLDYFVRTVGDAFEHAVLWLMPSAHAQCASPHCGQMLGVARSIRAELAISFVTLELDSQDDAAANAVSQVLRQIQHNHATASNDKEDDLLIESEYIWLNQQILISRVHSSPVSAALASTGASFDAKHLTIGQRGMLQTMHWTGHAFTPLRPNDVRARICATGLNFHDVATAIGIIDAAHSEKDGYHALGSEGTAVITAVGDNVSHVAVGDRVVIMDVDAAVFATEIQTSSLLCARIPDNLSDVDAAGMILPYATVLWSVCEKAHMKRGQSLLIHSAAGGVGIAAIHVARWIGAEIYCTVGSASKVDFLVNDMGIPRDRVFHSRDDSFVADVMRATGGKGVDAVLNSLSGELLHATWQCVAPFGCVLDIGKRDFTGRGRLDMYPFLHNRAYFGIDLATIAADYPAALVPYLNQVLELFREGHLRALLPTTVFEAENVPDAFRYMQKGVHMGRIVVRMPDDPAELPLTLTAPTPSFHPDAAYLLVGGLGGLGRSVISWMVEHGARQIMAVSPSAGTRAAHRELVDELRESGCELRCFAGDVADFEFMQTVVNAAAGLPIRGVLQMAMALRDVSFLNLDHDSWTAATNPKVKGTWNLHQLLRDQNLDFFVMTGSASGTLGSYGQVNYAAGNAFLDAMVTYRHSLGLPAAVLDISAVGDVGYVASTKDVAERLERAVARFMTEKEFLACLHLVIQRSSKQFIAPVEASTTTAYEDRGQVVLQNDMTKSLSDAENTIPWRRDPRMSIFRNIQGALEQGAGTGNEGLRSFMVSLSGEPEKLDDPATVTFLAQEISKRISAFLMKEDAALDVTQTLSSMGADSLVAIEIRNWWKQTLGIEISVLELADAGNTMEILGMMAVQRLKERFSLK